MMLLVAGCVCLFSTALAVNANASAEQQPINVAAEVRRIVQQSAWAAVGPNSTINSRQWTTRLVLTAATENTGEIFFYLNGLPLDQDTKGATFIDLMFNDVKTGFGVRISGNMKKLEEGSREYSRGVEAFRNREPGSDAIPSAGRQLYVVDILDINLLRVGVERRAVSREEYYAGTDSVMSI